MESAFEHLTKLKISVSVADVASPEAFVLFKADIPAYFSCVVSLVEERFSELTTSNKGWKYFWVDEDGDEIRITNDGEYRDYLKSIDTAPAVARIHVRVSEQPTEKTAKRTEEATTAPKPEDRPVHNRVVCDVCDTIIVGHRYKCMTCDDYDLCMRCEGNYRHKEHIMVRLPTPDIHDGHRAYRIFEKFRGLVGKMTPLLMAADEFVVGECEPDDQGPAQAAGERAACNVEKRPASKRPPQSKRSTETRGAGRETKDSKTEKSPSTKKREAKAEDRERTREQRSSGHAQSAEPPLAGHGGASSNGPFADSSLRYPRAYREAADWAAALNCPYPTMDEYPETCYPERFMPFVPPQVCSNPKNFQPLPPYHPFYYGNPNYAAMFEPYVCEGPKQAHTAQAAGPSGQPPQSENPANVRAQRPRSETAPPPPEPRPARSDSGIPESAAGGRNRAAPLFNVPEFLKNYVTPNDYVTGVQQIAETFAKIFDPLGMTLDIRPKPAPTASAARAAPTTPGGSEPATPPKPAQTQTPVEPKQDKTTETMVTSSSTVHIQTVPEQKQQRSKEMVSVAEEAVPSVSGTAKSPLPQDVAGDDETDEDSVGSWDNIDGQEVAHGDDDTCECEALDRSSESVREAAEPTVADSEGSKKDSAKKSPTIEDAHDDDDEKVATTAVKPPNNPDPSHIYSARPHVNHAIHTMMTMGFSNDDGWLTRLLETLNGDVPKALDMLLQQTPRS